MPAAAAAVASARQLRSPALRSALATQVRCVRRLATSPPTPWYLKRRRSCNLDIDWSAPIDAKALDAQHPELTLRNLSRPARHRLEAMRLQLELLHSASSPDDCIPHVGGITSRQWVDLLRCPDPHSLDRQIMRIYRIQAVMEKERLACPEVADSALPLLNLLDLHHFYTGRMVSELALSDPLILDLAFASDMSPAGLAQLCHDLRAVVGLNRLSRQPFRIRLVARGLADAAASAQFNALAQVFDPAGAARASAGGDPRSRLAAVNAVSPYEFVDGSLTDRLLGGGGAVYLAPGGATQLEAYDPGVVYILPGLPHQLRRLWPSARRRAQSLGIPHVSPPAAVTHSLRNSVRSLLALKNSRFFTDLPEGQLL